MRAFGISASLVVLASVVYTTRVWLFGDHNATSAPPERSLSIAEELEHMPPETRRVFEPLVNEMNAKAKLEDEVGEFRDCLNWDENQDQESEVRNFMECLGMMDPDKTNAEGR